MTGPTKVLLVSGSLRAESVNSALLRTAAALAGDRISTTLYEGLGTLPHLNPDDDPDGGRVPAAVTGLRRRLAEANAVLFCTPEYAASLPGSFKNLLDWTVGRAETYGKPVAWTNASSRPDPDAVSGAHDALRTVLGCTGADIAVAAWRRIQVPRTPPRRPPGRRGLAPRRARPSPVRIGDDAQRGAARPSSGSRSTSAAGRATADWFMRRSIVSRTPVRAMFGGRCQGMCPMCGVPGGLTMSL